MSQGHQHWFCMRHSIKLRSTVIQLGGRGRAIARDITCMMSSEVWLETNAGASGT